MKVRCDEAAREPDMSRQWIHGALKACVTSDGMQFIEYARRLFSEETVSLKVGVHNTAMKILCGRADIEPEMSPRVATRHARVRAPRRSLCNIEQARRGFSEEPPFSAVPRGSKQAGSASENRVAARHLRPNARLPRATGRGRRRTPPVPRPGLREGLPPLCHTARKLRWIVSTRLER